MKDKGVLPTGLGKKLEAIPVIDNLLVHPYPDIDYRLL